MRGGVSNAASPSACWCSSGQELCGELSPLRYGRGLGRGREDVEADVVGTGVEVFFDAVCDVIGGPADHQRVDKPILEGVDFLESQVVQ